MQRFTRLVANDPTVRAMWVAWQQGDFDSFEQMLLALCVRLADENQRMADVIRDNLRRSTAPVIVPPPT